MKVYSPVGKSYGQKAYTPQRLDYNVVARRVGTGQVLARLGHDRSNHQVLTDLRTDKVAPENSVTFKNWFVLDCDAVARRVGTGQVRARHGHGGPVQCHTRQTIQIGRGTTQQHGPRRYYSVTGIFFLDPFEKNMPLFHTQKKLELLYYLCVLSYLICSKICLARERSHKYFFFNACFPTHVRNVF